MTSYNPYNWYQRGKWEGQASSDAIRRNIQEKIETIKIDYPTSHNIDHTAEMEKLNDERLSAEPDYKMYPELKGLMECYLEQQKGFMEGAKCGKREMSFFYNHAWYTTRRLNTRYVGISKPYPDACSAIYIKNSEDGPIIGKNTDEQLMMDYMVSIPKIPQHRHMIVSAVDNALFCDEEPKEIFPAEVFSLIPEEIKSDINKIVEFLERYNEFWNPNNYLIIDTNLNSAVIEKTNCRLGVRMPENGSSATSFGSVLTPELKDFKLECDLKSLKLRHLGEDSLDWQYWRGCDKRHARLLKLVSEETKNSATLWGAGGIIIDHELPFPERICMSGESAHKGERFGIWSTSAYVCAMEGKNQRMLFWRLENRVPLFDSLPYLITPEDVTVKEEWKPGTRPIPVDEQPGYELF